MTIFWEHTSPKASETYCQGMYAEEYNKDDKCEYVDKSMVTQAKEVKALHDKLTIVKFQDEIIATSVV